MPRVVFIQRRMMHYRETLFTAIRDKLAAQGIDYVQVYGDPAPSELSKNDSGELPWGTHVPCRYLLNERLSWQDCRAATRGADLVILTQENRNLYNYLVLSVLRPPRLAYFGHGRNMQAENSDSWSERFKRALVTRVDWWFAYTGISQRTVASCGYPLDRITNVENAIDTTELRTLCDSISAREISDFRDAHALGTGPVGLFIGSLYQDKRIDVLLECARRLAVERPDFRLLVVGAGPQADAVRAAATQVPNLRYLGPLRGRQKALALRASDLMLNPGLVGLGLLDAFVAGLPLLTMRGGRHSPEIDYLVDGDNGLMTGDDAESFTAGVLRLLDDPDARQRIGQQAARAGLRYTVDNMAENFARGVQGALAAPRWRA